MCEPRSWVKKVVAIAHNAKAFDMHFILNRAVQLHWQPELIMNGLKIMCMKMEYLVFLDSVSFLPFPVRKLSEAFGFTAHKSWYPTILIPRKTWITWVPFPTSRTMARTTWARRRGQSSSRGTKARDRVFDNRFVLETYCQDDVTVLRKAC
jgi:hypothetical protein